MLSIPILTKLIMVVWTVLARTSKLKCRLSYRSLLVKVGCEALRLPGSDAAWVEAEAIAKTAKMKNPTFPEEEGKDNKLENRIFFQFLFSFWE